MSESQDLAALARSWFERVWVHQEQGAIEELCAPHVRVSGLGEPLVGVETYRAEVYEPFIAAFKGFDAEVLNILVSGDEVALRVRYTIERYCGGVMTTEGAVFARYEEGRIVEAWNGVDFLTMLQQSEKVAHDALPQFLAGEIAKGQAHR